MASGAAADGKLKHIIMHNNQTFRQNPISETDTKLNTNTDTCTERQTDRLTGIYTLGKNENTEARIQANQDVRPEA